MNKIVLSLIFATLYAVLNVSGSAIIKAKLKNQTLTGFSDWVSFLFSIQTISAFALIFISALLMFKALSFSNFTFIIPIATGINFVTTVIVGYFLFQEKVNYISFIGFSFILCGIIILSLNNLSNAR
jgi:multidrug transporter EmrE-like cation transporter